MDLQEIATITRLRRERIRNEELRKKVLIALERRVELEVPTNFRKLAQDSGAHWREVRVLFQKDAEMARLMHRSNRLALKKCQ